jgi:aspartyl-tRNA(Asn)/glutamyl-tRNA(Gln) amidotransferase subunit A
MLKLFPGDDETIEGTGEALRAGRTSCIAVLESCLARIEEWEPEVKAWVIVDRDGARRQAEARDSELAAGKWRGPLHGIPIGIKDIIDVQGLPTAAGFAPWRDRVADRDAVLVRSLRDAGAVILGKTVTTQFAWIDPPVTRNPWNLDRTPGGSSSGSAAAVATGMCLGAIGTQTGGSIIRPASFCGVAGLKPTYGFLSDKGILPFAPFLDHPGPIARTVRDLERILDQLIDYEEEGSTDPLTPLDSLATAERRPGRPPRLLRLRGYFDRRVDPEMLAAFEKALHALADAGASIIEESDDAFDFEKIVRNHRKIMAAQAAMMHESRFAEHRDDYAPHIRSLIEEGLATLWDLAHRALAYPDIRSLVEEGLATPLTRYIPMVLELCRSDVKDPGLFGADALVTPATIGPAPDTSTTGDPCINSPFSYLGWPVVSFPIALSADSLPLAIQVVGRYDDVDHERLLQTASWCESVVRRAYFAGSD